MLNKIDNLLFGIIFKEHWNTFKHTSLLGVNCIVFWKHIIATCMLVFNVRGSP